MVLCNGARACGCNTAERNNLFMRDILWKKLKEKPPPAPDGPAGARPKRRLNRLLHVYPVDQDIAEGCSSAEIIPADFKGHCAEVGKRAALEIRRFKFYDLPGIGRKAGLGELNEGRSFGPGPVRAEPGDNLNILIPVGRIIRADL